MADKMWDILNFLKNPSGEDAKDKNIKNAEAKLREINAQIEDAIENPDLEPLHSAQTAGVKTESPARGTLLNEEAEITPADTETPKRPPAEPKRARGPFAPASGVERAAQSAAPPSPKEKDGGADSAGGRLLDVPVASVRPNPFQPRKELGEQEILELSESIKEFGVLQPILVRRDEDGYELIAGERRLRAATRAGLSVIPAVVIETEPLNQQIIALVENIQRKNLSSIEEAVSLQDILSKTGWSQSELSRRTGRSQASVANKLRLLRLDPEVQGFVLSGRLGERQARSLLSLPPEEQAVFAQKAVDEDLSVRALEALVENWSRKTAQPKTKTARAKSDSPGGELLGDVAALITRHRMRGLSAQWKVKQMNQSSLVVEITVDLMKSSADAGTEELAQ